MKTNDFERAIDSLGGGIIIDEMKMHHVHVREVYAHTNNKGIMWDEHGRGFTAQKDGELNTCLILDEDGAWKIAKGAFLQRDKMFDLRFD